MLVFFRCLVIFSFLFFYELNHFAVSQPTGLGLGSFSYTQDHDFNTTLQKMSESFWLLLGVGCRNAKELNDKTQFKDYQAALECAQLKAYNGPTGIQRTDPAATFMKHRKATVESLQAIYKDPNFTRQQQEIIYKYIRLFNTTIQRQENTSEEATRLKNIELPLPTHKAKAQKLISLYEANLGPKNTPKEPTTIKPPTKDMAKLRIEFYEANGN